MKTITKRRAKMHNPPHPGEVLKALCLEPLGLTVSEAAKALDVSRKTLSSILNRRSSISPEMALRLSIAFNTTAESWLMQQIQYDLWRAAQRIEKLHLDQPSGSKLFFFPTTPPPHNLPSRSSAPATPR